MRFMLVAGMPPTMPAASLLRGDRADHLAGHDVDVNWSYHRAVLPIFSGPADDRAQSGGCPGRARVHAMSHAHDRLQRGPIGGARA